MKCKSESLEEELPQRSDKGTREGLKRGDMQSVKEVYLPLLSIDLNYFKPQFARKLEGKVKWKKALMAIEEITPKIKLNIFKIVPSIIIQFHKWMCIKSEKTMVRVVDDYSCMRHPPGHILSESAYERAHELGVRMRWVCCSSLRRRWNVVCPCVG
jgi:hypothetical protein